MQVSKVFTSNTCMTNRCGCNLREPYVFALDVGRRLNARMLAPGWQAGGRQYQSESAFRPSCVTAPRKVRHWLTPPPVRLQVPIGRQPARRWCTFRGIPECSSNQAGTKRGVSTGRRYRLFERIMAPALYIRHWVRYSKNRVPLK
jgi:hypothetical protein